jgi:dTMP kinase
LLICFEGIDGAGKSSLIDNFTHYLMKREIYCAKMHFPNKNSYYGKIIYDKLNGKREIPNDIFQGLYVLDFYNVQDWINFYTDNSEVKSVLILDRYFYSTLAYSNYYGNVEAIMDTIDQLKKPDLIFYLRVPAEVAINRLQNINKKDEHESNIELLEKTLKGYDNISDEYEFNVLDGTASVEDNLKEVIYLYERKHRGMLYCD